MPAFTFFPSFLPSSPLSLAVGDVICCSLLRPRDAGGFEFEPRQRRYRALPTALCDGHGLGFAVRGRALHISAMVRFEKTEVMQ